jgi:hypothetical protein
MHTTPVSELPNSVITIAQASPLDVWGDNFSTDNVKIPRSAHLDPPPNMAVSGSIDRGQQQHHRGTSFGVVYTTALGLVSVIGTQNHP